MLDEIDWLIILVGSCVVVFTVSLGILLSFEDWCREEDIEEKYEQFSDGYGDASYSLSEYKERHYQEYVENFKK